MIQINNTIKYGAFNGSKKQFQNAMQRKANFGKPNLGKLIGKSSIETWQYTEADKQAIRAGEKKPEDCKKTIWAACGRTRKIYVRVPQIESADIKLREQVKHNHENYKKTTLCKNWAPKQEQQKPWTKVDALHGLAMYRLKQWDEIHPKPTTDDESDILTHKKRRADAFSKIVTKILDDDRPKIVYRVLIYGKQDYSFDYDTYYCETFTKYETAVRAFIDNAIRLKREKSKSYTRAELTGFSKKYDKGFKTFEYDQRGHIAEILKPQRDKIDMSWYTRMNECKEIPIKQKQTALAA